MGRVVWHHNNKIEYITGYLSLPEGFMAVTLLYHLSDDISFTLDFDSDICSGGSRISPGGGRQLPRGGANIRFCQIFPKTA